MRAPKLHISLALALLAAASACADGTESHVATDEPATQDDHAGDSQGSSQNETVQLPAAPAQPDFAEWLPEACGPSERAIIGGSCQAVGRACPPNGWPEAPAGVTNLRYVKPDATGSGLSAEEPSGSIQAMLDSLTTGAVLLHTGTYQESVTVSSAVEVVGACAEATTIRSSSRSITSGTVELTGSARGLSNVTVTGPRPGVWIWSHQGAVSVRGVVVANAEYVGLSMTNDNKNITIEDVLIRDTRVSADDEGGYGWGMEVFGSNSVTLRGVGLRGNLDAGLYADGNTIEISAEDLAIYQTQPNPVTDSGGWGMALFSGVNMALRRGFFYQNRGMNTLVQGDNATLEAQDLVIRETLPDASDDSWGHALEAREAGHIEVTRGYIVENRDVAIAIMNDNSTGNFTDLTVRQTRHQVSDTQGGWGLLVSLGAQVILERAHFDDNQDAGVLIDQTGSYLRATDLSITHTVESPSGIGGWGLGVQFGASADLNRVHIDRSREVGMVLFDTGTVLNATDLTVTGTEGIACARANTPECPEGYGDGIELMGGASMTLERFELSGNQRVGLATLDANSVAEEDSWNAVGTPSLRATSGVITGNLIGVNIQGDGVDLYSDFTNVLNYDNLEVDLASSTLAMTSPADAQDAANSIEQ